ncbi:hypothetical protein [Rhizohabitans arisaemae]|uniref:hypothetical protein n=1 Tax=Rhizohabitans arisaemae TaxID=2720610 RepID=UPI0024B1A97E|nr:hypothetical protein [Rhizohabitans arisaemae]
MPGDRRSDAEDRRHRESVRWAKAGAWAGIIGACIAAAVWVVDKVTAEEKPAAATSTPVPGAPSASPSSGSHGVTATAPPAPSTPTAESGYVAKYRDKLLFFPDPLANNQAADLDVPVVGYVEKIDSDDYDVRWEYGTGLTGGHSGFFGTTDSDDPTPGRCAADARERSAGTIEAKDLIPGKSRFCVVTTEGDVAWMKLTRKQGGGSDADRARLTFTTRLWTVNP